MSKIEYQAIGKIHSPFKTCKGTPIQGTSAGDVEGIVEIFPQYAAGLKDLEGFSHIILLYHFHLSRNYSLMVKPYLDNKLHGVFATRAPSRPNPIGITVVRLIKIEAIKLYVCHLDIVDGTPLLDIKPYIPEFDWHEIQKAGWLEKQVHKLSHTKDDNRFSKK